MYLTITEYVNQALSVYFQDFRNDSTCVLTPVHVISLNTFILFAFLCCLKQFVPVIVVPVALSVFGSNVPFFYP